MINALVLILPLRLFQPVLTSIFVYAGYPFSTKWKCFLVDGTLGVSLRLVLIAGRQSVGRNLVPSHPMVPRRLINDEPLTTPAIRMAYTMTKPAH